jgi:hypothetical protein
VVVVIKPTTTLLNEGLRMAESKKITYEIRVKGHLEEGRSEWLGGLKVAPQPDGETILTGEIVDQSALNAILNRLHAMNIKLVSVEHVDATPSEDKSISLD